jgi:hypothetical protein
MKDSRNPSGFILRLIGLAVILFCHEAQSWACSCEPRGPCSSKRYGDADFVGEVLSRKSIYWDSGAYLDGLIRFLMLNPVSYQFKIRVLDRLRGPQKVGDIVEVRTGFGGGDCGYEFRIGGKYLVDAWKGSKGLETNICSLTAPIERSEVELRVLRKIAAGKKPPALIGELLRYASIHEDNLVGSLPDIAISLKPERGGQTYNTVTDSIGAFVFEDLPPGRYQAAIRLPGTLSVSSAGCYGLVSEGRLPILQIVRVDGGSCHMKIIVETSGSISGQIKFPNGKVVEGWINADTVKPDGKPWNTVLSTTSDDAGNYRLEHLNPGRYLIHFIRRAGFVEGEARIIELKEGEQKTGIVLIAK